MAIPAGFEPATHGVEIRYSFVPRVAAASDCLREECFRKLSCPDRLRVVVAFAQRKSKTGRTVIELIWDNMLIDFWSLTAAAFRLGHVGQALLFQRVYS